MTLAKEGCWRASEGKKIVGKVSERKEDCRRGAGRATVTSYRLPGEGRCFACAISRLFDGRLRACATRRAADGAGIEVLLSVVLVDDWYRRKTEPFPLVGCVEISTDSDGEHDGTAMKNAMCCRACW